MIEPAVAAASACSSRRVLVKRSSRSFMMGTPPRVWVDITKVIECRRRRPASRLAGSEGSARSRRSAGRPGPYSGRSWPGAACQANARTARHDRRRCARNARPVSSSGEFHRPGRSRRTAQQNRRWPSRCAIGPAQASTSRSPAAVLEGPHRSQERLDQACSVNWRPIAAHGRRASKGCLQPCSVTAISKGC